MTEQTDRDRNMKHYIWYSEVHSDWVVDFLDDPWFERGFKTWDEAAAYLKGKWDEGE